LNYIIKLYPDGQLFVKFALKIKPIMNIQSKKLELVQLILNTEKPSILVKVEALLKKEKVTDWWEETSEAEKIAIGKGIAEADNGDLIPHAKVMKEAKARYKLK
jgi:predicted transcriptional regulator